MKCWVAWSSNEQRLAWHWVICWRPYGIYGPGGGGRGGLCFIPVPPECHLTPRCYSHSLHIILFSFFLIGKCLLSQDAQKWNCHSVCLIATQFTCRTCKISALLTPRIYFIYIQGDLDAIFFLMFVEPGYQIRFLFDLSSDVTCFQNFN